MAQRQIFLVPSEDWFEYWLDLIWHTATRLRTVHYLFLSQYTYEYCFMQRVETLQFGSWVKVKVGKVLPITGHEGPEGEYRYSHTLFMTSALRWGWVVSTKPLPLYPQERPGTHCTVGWVGPRAGLEGCGKSRPPPGFDPRTVQPVASRYTD